MRYLSVGVSKSLAVFLACLLTSTLCAQELAAVRGFGMDTPAGAGGRVLKVTSLSSAGDGSLRWALEQEGPRIIVFEVGGVIDLEGRSLNIAEPYVTVAGQTAPSPGITLIRGGIGITTHDVRIQHLRVRPGSNDKTAGSGWEPDGIGAFGPQARNIHIDHCSVSWAVDENLSASGPRTKGPDATSGQITFSHSIIAEALDYATHKKGKHSKGLLLHDFVQEVAVIGNLFAHNDRRNPYFKAHTTGVVINNYMYNLGNAAVQLGYIAQEWQGEALQPANPQVAVVGNELQYGRDTYSDLALVAYQGDVYLQDNRVLNLDGAEMAQVQGAINLLEQPPLWPEGLIALPVSQVRDSVLRQAGARPWDRDSVDRRIIASVRSGTGRIIDREADVGGYPQQPARYRALSVPADADQIPAWLDSFIPAAD